MLKMLYRILLSLGLVMSLHAAAWAQGDAKEAEIEALKQRIQQLEAQNRAILRLLEDVKAQLAEKGVQTVRWNNIGQPSEVARDEKTSSYPNQPLPQKEQKKDDDVVRWKELTSGQSRLQFYGFLRLDLITDDSRPDNSQIPFFILSEDPRGGVRNENDFALHPRLTRLGIRYKGPEIGNLGGAGLSGTFEVDFQNGGRESRQIIRIRHAYLKLSKGDFSLLGGQTWDIISPIFPTVNNDTLMWNTGNMGDRRPQIRVGYEPKLAGGQFSFVGGIGLTGAIDAKDLDNDGLRDGEAVGPNLQGRIGYTHTLGSKDRKLDVGVSGHYAWEETIKPVAGRDEFRSQSLGLDYAIPFHERLTVRGEAWFGRNLSDFRGGVGQGINTVLGTEIRSRGGWAELGLKVNKVYLIYPGYTIDDPKDRDVPAQGRVKNRAWYIVNRFKLSGPFLVGIDYLRWTTDYKGLERGVANRFNLYLQYDF
jgi:hypothetical protein